MERIKTGLLAGLIAVTFTTAVNIIARRLGLLPEPMDMKYMAELVIDPARYPMAAFLSGILIHIASGAIIGALYTLLIKRWTPLTGILFMIFNWLIMMVVLFPLIGRGFFGLKIGPVMAEATFILNLLYGIAVGWAASRLSAEHKPLKGGSYG